MKYLVFLLFPVYIFGQSDSTTYSNSDQYAGLGKAASAIYNSDKRYSISGFGEANFVNYSNGNDISLGDLELYYTQLYRFSTFFGFKITDKLIFNGEFLIEHLRDGSNSETNIIPEAYLDYRHNSHFGVRAGFVPLTIGYINSNDEPILFHSVNRPEVERLIIPTSWIQLGVMTYGNITKGLDYFLGVFSTPDAEEFISPTFIRGGAEPKFETPKSFGINYQLLFSGYKDLQIGVSGFYGDTGQNHKYINSENEQVTVNSILNLAALHLRYDFSNIRIIMVGTYSSLSDTDGIYELNEVDNRGEVIGSSAYGYYAEVGMDILYYFNISKESENRFFDFHEMKLPIFARYERINTHNTIDNSLYHLPYKTSDMEIITMGLNYNPNEDFVVKANYQIRNNKSKIDNGPISNLFEFGIGFNF